MADMRGHHEGSIFQRKTGRDRGTWVAAVTMRDGRRASRTAHSRDDAKAQLAELLRLRDAGAPITGRIRLSAYLERWVNEPHGLAPSTRRKHESAIRVHLIPRLGHFRLSELRPADVSLALGDCLASGLGAQSVRHLRATLRRSLADAVRDGLVSRNVGGLAEPPRLPHRERPVLSADDARRLIDSTRGTRYGPLWAILVTTGLRISEALGLAWSDIELGGNDAAETGVLHGLGRGRTDRAPHPARERGAPSLTVRRQLARENGQWVHRPTKTAKGRRVVPLTQVGVEALRAQRAQQDADLGSTPRPIDGLVFTSEKGNPLHGENMSKLLAAALYEAGLPRCTPHDLRHSAATTLYAMGVDLETIADMLGHSSSRITADLYRHRAPALQRDAAAKMQEAVG